ELLTVQFLGASQRLEVQVGSQVITALQADKSSGSSSLIESNLLEAGQPVTLQWLAQHMVMLDD
ncbi:MAG: TOBE domain-containing protein, partial [Rhodoferax sp.]|nr:TOBE domain-containing protein [Rhodoferax sp.]